MLGFYVLPTAKVIRRRDLGFKSHPKDWRSPGSNSRPLVYKASSLTTTPRRLLLVHATDNVRFAQWLPNSFKESYLTKKVKGVQLFVSRTGSGTLILLYMGKVKSRELGYLN